MQSLQPSSLSTCGMSIIVFPLASKQLITVYLGVILGQSSDDPNFPPNYSNSQSLGEDTKSKIISRAVLAITVLVTGRINNLKQDVLYEKRKERQRKLIGAGMYPNRGNDGLNNGPEIFVSGNQSLTEILLEAPSGKKGPSSGYGYEREEGYGYGWRWRWTEAGISFRTGISA
ncbi:hypothetical protein K435DRAFT_808239 [Dendrothele bispora CBS 962.96]|uniref:Uncharacterized protein n=1 Tax=Dendrothele bispora (strain CBS 962.96) TaxID=1314807 RepID=A0A4S8L2A5_DENBC|nr:hypothetical protein K435DRAFT_808239 [Dendrothele bispora CBS 962.96]